MNAPILIVDDDRFFAETLRQLVVGKGYTADVAHTAEEGMIALMRADIPYRVALLDIRLPDMNGTDLAALVAERSPSTSVIFMTAFDQEEVDADPLAGRAVALFSKPLRLDSFFDVLMRHANVGGRQSMA